jgi:ubiquinone/menaquinone biosynthesis C-methylase UbiE
LREHAARDRAFHAEIATVYDYLTNEPRVWPNELLFRPIDRCIPSVSCLLDLGCGTGQLIESQASIRSERHWRSGLVVAMPGRQ